MASMGKVGFVAILAIAWSPTALAESTTSKASNPKSNAVSSAAIPTSQLRHCYEHIDGKINQQQETVKLSPNLLPSCA